jgi:hypothetical protein
LLRDRRGFARDLLLLAIAALVAIGLSAAAVLPAMIELPYVGVDLKRGTASLFPEEVQSEYAISPRLLLAAALRRIHVSVSTEGLPAVWRSFGGLNAWYIGVFVLALALLGLLRVTKYGAVGTLIVLLLVGLLEALGPRAPLNPLRLVPFLGTMRFQPHRGMMLVGLALAMLSAQGVSWLATHMRQDRARVRLGLVLFALIAFDYHPARAVFQVRPSYFSAEERDAYRWLCEQGEGFRAWDYALSPTNQYLYTYGIVEAPVPRFWGQYDNGSVLYSLALFRWVEQAVTLDLGAVRYVLLRPEISPHSEAMIDFERMGYNQVAWESDAIVILERPDWGPYARLYSDAALYVGSDRLGGLNLLSSLHDRGIALVCGDSPYLDDYDLDFLRAYDHLLLDEALEREPGASTRIKSVLGDRVLAAGAISSLDTPQDLGPAGRASVAPRLAEGGTGSQAIEIWTTAREPMLLVASESWYPNWRVSVDGEPADVVRANYAYLGVWVPGGEHRVEFRYHRPWHVGTGWILSLSTPILLFGLFAWRRRRR